jgi:hypothetical protein
MPAPAAALCWWWLAMTRWTSELEELVGSRRLETAVDLAAAGLPVLAVHHPRPVLGNGMVGCSCDRFGCWGPAAHPMGELGVGDATTDPERVGGWWKRWPDANVATVAGVAVEVVNLTYPDLAGELAGWLRAHGAGDGPVAELPSGQLRFLGRAVASSVRGPWVKRLGGGWVERVAHGVLVLLPPSRVAEPGRGELVWRTGPHVALPDGAPLAGALMALPSPEELRSWGREGAFRTR